MTRYEPAEIVLVRFPFTDLTSTKKRPALVVSPADYSARYGDVVLLALTSQPQPEEQCRVQHWQQAGLPKPTWFKPLLATVATGLLVRSLGRLADADRLTACRVIRSLIAADFLRT